MRNIDDLLDEAKYGQLTKAEISYVAQKIKESSPDNDMDLYTLLHILGLAEAKQHRKLIENFLYYPSCPMISGMALKALCTYWNEAEVYLDQIKAFIKGADWDKDGDVRLSATHCAGDFLSQQPEKDLLLLLLHIFYEHNDTLIAYENTEDPDQILAYDKAVLWREVTFEALAFAVGKTIDDFIVTPGKNQNPMDHDFIHSVLEQVDQLLKRLK